MEDPRTAGIGVMGEALSGQGSVSRSVFSYRRGRKTLPKRLEASRTVQAADSYAALSVLTCEASGDLETVRYWTLFAVLPGTVSTIPARSRSSSRVVRLSHPNPAFFISVRVVGLLTASQERSFARAPARSASPVFTSRPTKRLIRRVSSSRMQMKLNGAGSMENL